MLTSGHPNTSQCSLNALQANEAPSVQSLSYSSSCNTAAHPCQADVRFFSETSLNLTHRSCTLPGSNVVRHEAHFKQGLCHLFPIALTYDRMSVPASCISGERDLPLLRSTPSSRTRHTLRSRLDSRAPASWVSSDTGRMQVGGSDVVYAMAVQVGCAVAVPLRALKRR